MRALAVVFGAGLVGCSVFGDFTGLSGGTPNDGDAAAPAVDASQHDGAATLVGDGGGPTSLDFVEDFDRADGGVGNGWLEKTPGVFSIRDQGLIVQSGDWTRYLLYRPSEENLTDVALSVDLTWSQTSVNCDAALVARLQTDKVLRAEPFSGYATFVNDAAGLTISRVDQTGESVLEGVALTEKVNTTSSYRMSFRVTGDNPVRLESVLEKEEGGSYRAIGTVSTLDGATSGTRERGALP